MLSRAALLSGQQARSFLKFATRATGTSAPVNSICPSKKDDKGSASASDKGPLWSRPVRQEPGKVRYAFIPEEWFQFFYKKTGVTGPYTFFVTFTTYLVSKEIYVLEHEYYTGISVLILWTLLITKLGPTVAAYLDKEIDEIEKGFNQGRVDEKNLLEEQIKDEERSQWSMEGQNVLVKAKRENVGFQLEAAYRQRLASTYSEVKKRLDYQVEKQNIERRIAQKNLVDWVVRSVKSAITPDQEKQNIDKCIADLGLLAKA